MKERDILQGTFRELGFTEYFCMQCKVMGLARLEDALLFDPQALLMTSGFSYHWLTELTIFLSERIDASFTNNAG